MIEKEKGNTAELYAKKNFEIADIDNLDKSKIVIKKLDQIEDLIEFLFR